MIFWRGMVKYKSIGTADLMCVRILTYIYIYVYLDKYKQINEQMNKQVNKK